MHTVREILRLMLDQHLKDREIGRICSVSHSTIGQYRKQVMSNGLKMEQVNGMTDDELKNIIKKRRGKKKDVHRAQPDFSWIHQELKKKSVTLQLLWEEYRERYPDGYKSSQFNHLYRQWAKKLNPSMRQTHKAGEKVFVDFSGHTILVKDRHGGPDQKAEIFVAVLGASNYTYAEAVFSQNVQSWIQCHTNTFGYFGGVPELIIPDNLKSAVHTPDRYEPILNHSFLEMASHYGTTIVPARVRKPKDKAKAENGVLIVQRWILAALRNREFFDLSELNEEIVLLLEKLNTRLFKQIKGSRRLLFESLEKSKLKPLPAMPYSYGEWKKVRVNLDYHVALDEHYYSVPFQLIHQAIFLRYDSRTVEVYHNNQRIASHLRNNLPGGKTTVTQHMPKSHQQYVKWTPSKLLDWARGVGQYTAEVMTGLINSDRHGEQTYRSCLGIKRLSTHYAAKRVEAACQRAIAINGRSYRSIKSILEQGLDKRPLPEPPKEEVIIHENIRGNEYFALTDEQPKPGELPC